jgi:hypothetical protein
MNFENTLYFILSVDVPLLCNNILIISHMKTIIRYALIYKKDFLFVIVKVISQPVAHDLCNTIHVSLIASVTSISTSLVARTLVLRSINAYLLQ